MKSIFTLNILVILIHQCFTYSNNNNTCDELQSLLYKHNTSYILNYIDNKMYKLKHKVTPCIKLLTDTAQLELLDFYLTQLHKRRVSFRQPLQSSINRISSTLDAIVLKHRYEQIHYQTIYPAFQWAQSLNNIFIEIKFAHRHDSPGCLDMKNYTTNIQSHSIRFEGYCVLGDVPIKIEFDINLFKGINKDKSMFTFGSVGKGIFTLYKEEESVYWEKLVNEGSGSSGVNRNMRVWFEMQEKYEEELKGIIEHKDEEGENVDVDDGGVSEKEGENDNEEQKGKKRKKGKKKKLKGKKKNNNNITNVDIDS